MTPFEIYKDNFCISTDKSKLDLEMVHLFLSEESYWSKNISFEKVKKAAANSITFGVYSNQVQIGYARVISDCTSVAYLGDVFILPAYRGKGLSKWLVQTIMNYPELQGLRRWILLTADAHSLYKQFGWKEIAAPERWMEIHNKDVYAAKI